ncbi:MAG: DUF4905 domain-containing protein [Bacteroidota bacterium]|nr:DUF4905 domain-containing protein [Bacteroidota bacterium]
MPKKLIQNFAFKFKGSIWKMLLDDNEQLLVLEIRDNQNRICSFATIDLIKNELLWKDHKFSETWWIGVSAVKARSILFYIYLDEQNPVPESYFLFSIDKKSVIWESKDFKFLTVIDEGFLGHILNKNQYQELIVEAGSGDMVKLSPDSTYLGTKSAVLPKQENKLTYYPFHYPEETGYFDTIKKYLVLNHNIHPVKAIDYLELGTAIIISFYLYRLGSQKDNYTLDNFLLILNKEGKQVFLEKIEENLPGIGMGIFFVVKNQLIFSTNKSEIKSYQIDSL